jgi:putative ABC transport system ATP-binding protein
MIKVEKLTKGFKSGRTTTLVLRGIDLEIKDGEFVAIMGRSGAGKSTLLYQMSLLDIPTSGSVFIQGEDMSQYKNGKRTKFRLDKMGYIFQDYALMPELTAQENVMAPLMMSGLSKRAARKIAQEMLTKMGLKDRFTNLPSQLSGGEQQRVSVARAIAGKPTILFADEPTANLDSVNAKNVLDILADLHKQGQTIVMVTHEKEYGNYAQRIIELRDGLILKETKTKKRKKKLNKKK